jgi:LPXTG-motif cell wall-anchored protein
VALLFDGATLADNGGPTETVALYAGSPAVDAVPAGEPSVTVDQRGVARDARSDAGAYEYVPAPAPQALAATGSTTAGWAAAAAGVLLAAGAAVIATARRRRA